MTVPCLPIKAKHASWLLHSLKSLWRGSKKNLCYDFLHSKIKTCAGQSPWQRVELNLYRTSQKHYSKSDLVVTLFQSTVHGKQFNLLSHRQDIDSSWHRLTGISCNFPLKKNSWENTCIGLVHVNRYWRYAGSLPLPLTQLNSCFHITLAYMPFTTIPEDGV